MSKRAYVPSFRWGNACIESVDIIKETPKTYTLKHIGDIYGHRISWYGDRTLKTRVVLFHNLQDAIDWLAGKIDQHLTHLSKEQKRFASVLAELKDLPLE